MSWLLGTRSLSNPSASRNLGCSASLVPWDWAGPRELQWRRGAPATPTPGAGAPVFTDVFSGASVQSDLAPLQSAGFVWVLRVWAIHPLPAVDSHFEGGVLRDTGEERCRRLARPGLPFRSCPTEGPVQGSSELPCSCACCPSSS